MITIRCGPALHRDFGDAALPFDDAQRAADLRAVGSDGEFGNRDPQHWRRLRNETVAALLAASASLVAPSRSALANQLRLAPELHALPAHVIAHGLAPWPADAPRIDAVPERPRLRLLVPGRVRRGKGAELLAAALPRLREHAEFFLLGAGADAHALFGENGVHILLDYRRDALPGLLAQIRPDAALLLPTVAETYSYTCRKCAASAYPSSPRASAPWPNASTTASTDSWSTRTWIPSFRALPRWRRHARRSPRCAIRSAGCRRQRRAKWRATTPVFCNSARVRRHAIRSPTSTATRWRTRP